MPLPLSLSQSLLYCGPSLLQYPTAPVFPGLRFLYTFWGLILYSLKYHFYMMTFNFDLYDVFFMNGLRFHVLALNLPTAMCHSVFIWSSKWYWSWEAEEQIFTFLHHLYPLTVWWYWPTIIQDHSRRKIKQFGYVLLFSRNHRASKLPMISQNRL